MPIRKKRIYRTKAYKFVVEVVLLIRKMQSRQKKFLLDSPTHPFRIISAIVGHSATSKILK